MEAGFLLILPTLFLSLAATPGEISTGGQRLFLLILITLHITLHWRWIVNMSKNMITIKKLNG